MVSKKLTARLATFRLSRNSVFSKSIRPRDVSDVMMSTSCKTTSSIPKSGPGRYGDYVNLSHWELAINWPQSTHMMMMTWKKKVASSENMQGEMISFLFLSWIELVRLHYTSPITRREMENSRVDWQELLVAGSNERSGKICGWMRCLSKIQESKQGTSRKTNAQHNPGKTMELNIGRFYHQTALGPGIWCNLSSMWLF